MKTAAAPLQTRSAEPSRSAARRPFLSGPVQRQAEETAQAKPAMSRPGDRWEREADHMADRATSGNDTGLAREVTPVTSTRLREAQGPTAELEGMTQPKAEEEPAQAEEEAPQAEEEPAQAEEEPAQAQEDPAQTQEEPAQAQEEPAQAEEETAQAEEDPAQAEEEPAQAAATARGAERVTDAVADQMAAARGRGDRLAPGLKAEMQARFGADFDGIRIHTDSAAVQITRALRAHAVTRGGDIFFNAGQFAPDTGTGRHLLAHELTHTLQQGAARVATQDDPLQSAADPDAGGYDLRPEVVEAIRLAKGEEGKVNAKKHGPDGKRIGSDRLTEYFNTALGGPVIHPSILERVTPVQGKDGKADALPSWCGIFTWWAMKSAGIPIPDWKLGATPLEALRQRGPDELPRKGDIVIKVKPNNHFAMVTGLESEADAEGKPRKLVRIATINGNTAGEDNLGGQVQEKWHTLANWDHALDPVGKLSLPPAPMVHVGRAPAEDATAPAEPEAAATPEAEAAQAQPDLPPVAPPPEAAPEAAPPETDLTLPPSPDAGPAEVVAEVKAADLGTTSEGAVDAYLAASPSVMAVTQHGFAGTVTSRLDGEEKDLADNPPVLKAQTSGLDDIPTTAPTEVAPTDAAIGDGTNGPDPGPLGAASVPAPAPFTGNKDREKQLDEEDSGSFWDAFTNFLKKFVTGIKTTDPSISTDAGAAPRVDMTGEADATRMSRQRDEAGTSVAGARDEHVTAFKDNPGQENIQPVKVDEERPVALTAEPGEPLEAEPDTGMADYAAAPIPEDVRGLADAKIAAKLAPNLAKPQADAAEAATARDTDKDREVSTAETAAAKLSKTTDAEQRRLVIENRGKVAKLQGEGINEANASVAAFGKEAAGKETEARSEVQTHVKEEQGKADKEIADGEAKAEAHRVQGEKDAADKKAELEKEQKKGSWWDRAKNAIKSAVSAITKAIDGVFNWVRKKVAEAIEWAKNAAIGLINKARKWVVDKINGFRDWAKAQVDKYLKDAFPGLAKRINSAIDSVADTAVAGVNAVADAAIAGVTALADGLAKVLDKILSVYQTALKTAVRVAGAVATGDFAEALKAIIEGACDIAGIDPKPVFAFFDRAGKAVMAILKDPVPFIKNLFGAVGDGMSAFFKNIRTHLIQGVIGWLTGALGEVQITGPFEFSFSGILRIVLQVLGLTYASLKARVIKAWPPSAKVFDVVETGFELVKKLITEGPMALLDDIMAQLANLKDMVLGAIREWLIVTAIKEGVVWLLSLTNPASAIVKAIKLVFDLVMFLVERYQQIKDFVMTVYEGVAAVVGGNFTAVTKAVENALAKSIPILISLFASILGLGGIAKQVKGIIAKVTKPINKVIDKVVGKIVAFAKKIVAKVKTVAGKAKQKAKETVEKIATWWKERRKFKTADGGSHSIQYRGTAEKADLTIASDNPQLISTFLTNKQKSTSATAPEKKVAKEAAAQYKIVLGHETELEKKRKAREKVSTSDKPAYRAATGAVNAEIRKFRNALDALSTILQKVSFEDEDDALVRTHIDYKGAGQKNAAALPLTFLSGNTKGSGPSQDPPDWKHAADLDTKPDGTSASTWVRGHLVNDNLHGPGVASNLVPITKTMNSDMESQAEAPAKAAIRERGKLFFYRAEVTFWPDPKPVGSFPQRIVVTWGTAKRKDSNKKEFEADQTRGTVPITMPVKPPAVATAFRPTINGGSPTQLEAAIKPSGPVTGYFVSNVLLAEFEDKGAYSSKSNMQDRLYTNVRASIVASQGAAVAAARRGYVQATYAAITKGDVMV